MEKTCDVRGNDHLCNGYYIYSFPFHIVVEKQTKTMGRNAAQVHHAPLALYGLFLRVPMLVCGLCIHF